MGSVITQDKSYSYNKADFQKANEDVANISVAHTLIGEAVGEGEEGMKAVYHVMQNKSKFSNAPIEKILENEYSAYKRPDLNVFVSKQPKPLVDAAFNIVSNPGEDTTNGALHFENFKKYGVPSYAVKEGGYIPLATIGKHTFFITLREYNVFKNRGLLIGDINNLITGKENAQR